MKSVALVDDHVLLRQGLASLVNTFDGYQVCFEADNGRQFIDKLSGTEPPVAVLVDINMPIMDGFETAAWIKANHPGIKILALSMSDEEEVIIKMLQAGAHGYILKNSTPEELQQALDAVIRRGYYMNDLVGSNLITALSKEPAKEDETDLSVLNDRELEFVRLSCTDLSYVEIADKMNISIKTIDFYKNNIEKKIGIKNRVTLALFAVKCGLVKP